MLLLKILGALLALGLGVWLGLPGRYDQSASEIGERLDQAGGRTRKAKRHFTPLAYFQRKLSTKPRTKGARFKLAQPGEASEEAKSGPFRLTAPGERD